MERREGAHELCTSPVPRGSLGNTQKWGKRGGGEERENWVGAHSAPVPPSFCTEFVAKVTSITRRQGLDLLLDPFTFVKGQARQVFLSVKGPPPKYKKEGAAKFSGSGSFLALPWAPVAEFECQCKWKCLSSSSFTFDGKQVTGSSKIRCGFISSLHLIKQIVKWSCMRKKEEEKTFLINSGRPCSSSESGKNLI